jgi:histidinol dehydrogenase/phosphoribosyl-ATP pyrophosphohydrolase
MIIPSIDLINGNAVQLIGGKALELDAGDPRPLARRFSRVGEIAVIDLDSALGQGNNQQTIEDLLAIARCRVGGGIRTAEQALDWLDRGAEKVILGTAARSEVLEKLPKDRVIVALDAVHGEVVVDGWRTKTGCTVEQRMAELRPYCDHFMVTLVEREGRMQGIDLEQVDRILAAADGAEITFAGGVTTAEEIAQLDQRGADAQVGMALYKGELGLTEAFAAPLEPAGSNGLWPTVVCDEMGIALGLCWSSLDSLTAAIDQGRGIYQSRKRGLWVKGETSGAVQDLLRVELDCDRDALRFTVRQAEPGFCHKQQRTCWGQDDGISALARRLQQRTQTAPPGSYVERLLTEPKLLAAKLSEEATELAVAQTPEQVAHETADVLFFAFVAMTRGQVTLSDVCDVLRNRSMKVRRRPGNAKGETAEVANSISTIQTEKSLDQATLTAASRILDAVEAEGEDAVRRYAEEFGDCEPGAPLVLSKAELLAAAEAAPQSMVQVLQRSADRIRAFAAKQLGSIQEFQVDAHGMSCSQEIAPVQRAGCYAPGGRYPLPSSVLMTAITAKTAGVKEVVVASPKPSQATLVAAALAGADKFLVVGGAQAIAALTFGIPGVNPCDIIVGPGNRFVTAAKKLVQGRVGIDMLAGPSELVVVSDGTGNAEIIAADLLAQAEHDADALPLFLTTCPSQAGTVQAQIQTQLKTLPTADVARQALKNGGVKLCRDRTEMAETVNRLAPEHLSLQLADPASFRAKIQHYGALFEGEAAAEVFGDYGVGPNHVLPTEGSARFTGGLSVFNFLRIRTRMCASKPDPSEIKPSETKSVEMASTNLIQDVAELARMEGLEAHARAALLRG